MALVDTQEVKLSIRAETLGASDVSTLVAQIDALGKEGTDAARAFGPLSQELNELSRKQVQIQGLKEAITGAKDARAAFIAAREHVDNLDRALAAAKGANVTREVMKGLQADLRAANTELAKSQRAWEAKKQALTDIRGAAKNAGIDTRALAQAEEQLVGRINAVRQAAQKQVDAINGQRQAAAARAQQIREQAAEEERLAAIVNATRARMNDAAKQQLVYEKQAWDESQRAFMRAEQQKAEAARATAEARARQLREQAAEEDRLAKIVLESRRKMEAAAKQQLDAEKRQWAEAQRAAAAYAKQTADFSKQMAAHYDKQFANIGIRSIAAIKAEIHSVQQSLTKLAQNNKLSAEEFDRAWRAGQARIAALNAEIKNVSFEPLNQSAKGATNSIIGMLPPLKAVAKAVSAAFGAREIARMVTEYDSVNRTLKAVAGSAEAAAKELGYIVATSNRLGLDLSSASRAYAQFAAVTKGTALEGQKAKSIFEAVAGSMAVLGKSATDTDGALLALSQMVSKGVVSMEELRQQLAERLPGAMQAAARGVGLTEAELIKMVSTGQVLAEDLLPALADQLRKMYGTEKELSGYTAAWNRLLSAIRTSAGEFGQTEVVMRGTALALGTLREIVALLGTGFVTAAEGVSFFGRALGTVVAHITNPTEWGALREELSRIADESLDRIVRVARETKTAELAQRALGAAVEQTAQSVQDQNNGWLAMTARYSAVNAQIAAYTETTKQSIKAREEEAALALEQAKVLGDAVLLRQIEARAAADMAAETQRLADLKAAELGAAQSQLIAQQAIVAASEAESSAKQKLIDETATRIDKLQEESAELEASANQQKLKAAILEAETQALKDNSAQLDEYRAAYVATTAEVARLVEAEKAGLATKEQVNEATRRQAAAAVLYRDAMKDTQVAMQGQMAAQRSANEISQQTIQLQITEAQRSLEIAKRKGNERAAREATVRIKKLEAQLADQNARAALQEAQAVAELARQKLDEARRTGENVEAAEQELAQAVARVKVRQIELQISNERIRQINDEINAILQLRNVMNEGGQGGEKLAQGMDNASQAGQNLGGISKWLIDVFEKSFEAIGKYSAAAEEAAREAGKSADSFAEFAAEMGALEQQASSFVSGGKFTDLKNEIREFEAAAKAAEDQAALLSDQVQTGFGSNMQGVYESLAAMSRFEAALARASAAAARTEIAMARLDAEMEKLGSKGAQGLDDLRLRLLELNGTEEEIARARAARERAELEMEQKKLQIELKKAQLEGDKDKIDLIRSEIKAYDEMLVMLGRVHAEERKARERARKEQAEEERQQRNEERRRAREEAASAAGTTDAAPVTPATTPSPTVTHVVELRQPDAAPARIAVQSARDVDTLTAFLREMNTARSRTT